MSEIGRGDKGEWAQAPRSQSRSRDSFGKTFDRDRLRSGVQLVQSPRSRARNNGRVRMARFQSILETVGHTPVVRINRLAPDGVNLYVKIEAFNIQRRRLMRFLGAKVVITPAAERAVGMVKKTIELAEAHGWFMTRQFENEANPDFHSRTTAREIIDDFASDTLDFWVTGYGTGGTLKGVGRVLRRERPGTKIIVCEPSDAPLLESGIEQKRLADGSPAEPHPSFKPHPMQGWTPAFIPKLTGDAVDMKLIDRVLPISGADAIRYSKELAAKEGIFVGITSGGTFAGALRVASEAPKGANILCMLPDTGERYLSTPLFADVPVDMSEEELAILRSIPSA